MKKNAHPKYQKVLFVDSASGFRFVCGSTLQTDATEEFEGVEYPVSYLSISSASHPFFTGSNQLVDSEGRVDKFRKRFERTSTLKAIPQNNQQPQQQSAKQHQPKQQPKTEQKSEQKTAAKAKPAPATDKKAAAPEKKESTDKKAAEKPAKAAKKK